MDTTITFNLDLASVEAQARAIAAAFTRLADDLASNSGAGE